MKQHQYTAYYCEENIYNLIKDMIEEKCDHLIQYYAVLITNPFQQTYIKCQKSSPLVIWDYHVIMVAKHTIQTNGKISQNSYVYDFDSTLPMKCDFNTYFKQALGFQKPQATLKSLFRVVEGQKYLDYFASDRHHMIKNGKYQQPPPKYPCLKGNKQEKSNNLQEYLDTTNNDIQLGKWMTEEQFQQFFADKKA
ncbi:unnamed protein product [Paramecium sonneborni]|uniref:Protein N-terminal glutamine amidohydrolase n=1 Tax=Paramecium sonneborni TaxID=65129 RepID=A0A8S1R632_9CILI|nr:unnamed protein product [Paramecium sonneborni]